MKLEQIRTITIKAHVVTRSPEGVENTEIWHLYLNEYEEVVPEATYNLIVSSQKYLLSVDLVRNPERTPHAEWRRRLETMIQALREEAVRNFVLAQRGGIPIPDSTSPKAEMMAHGLRSVLRAGQHVLPELQDLDARPTETIADLDRLSVEELQARLDATFIQSKKYEAQHLQLAQNKNIAMLNHHLSLEIANTQLLINLEEALKRKGVIAKPPESEEAKSAIAASEEAHTAMLQQFAEACNTQ